tara:strand:+ start:1570 stop:1767 length:198 start_codon:yes stop_codon:yes gene_type:complete
MNLKKTYTIFRKVKKNNAYINYSIHKNIKENMCQTCGVNIQCYLCKKFGIEGQKWYSQGKQYMSE